MADVVIFGVGQWAELASYYFTHDSPHRIVAFTVDRQFAKEQSFQGLPVVPYDELERLHPPDAVELFIPISFVKMNHARAEKYFDAKRRGYRLTSYVSSKATTWPDFSCGENCFILEDNTIQPTVRIGNNVIMWCGNHIGHHTTIEDHVMITSHVVISGCCTLGEYSFFGVNSTIRDETVIAPETLVGMGVTIVADTKPFEMYRVPRPKADAVRSDELRAIQHKTGN